MARKPILEIRNLCLQRGDTHILDKLNWRVESGEHWVILGPNGCGKTSLLSTLIGYKSPTSGDINILGNTFGDSDWTQLRLHIGLVSSSLNNLMTPDEPILETIVSGKYAMIDLWHEPTSSDKRIAQTIIKQIECLHLTKRSWGHLSQGERQRVLIGRSLMAKPKLLILDEPCAGLDPVAREHFLQFLNRLSQKKNSPSIVLTTHHVEEIMPLFTHALLLREGKLMTQGVIKETLRSDLLSKTFSCPVTLSRRQGRYYLKTKTNRNSVM